VMLRDLLPTGRSQSAASKYKNGTMTATRSQSVPRNTSGNHCRVARILATGDSSCPDLGTKLWTKLLSILPVGVTICDGRGVCIYKNAKASEYFPGRVAGRCIRFSHCYCKPLCHSRLHQLAQLQSCSRIMRVAMHIHAAPSRR
jgi:hypothetical protein